MPMLFRPACGGMCGASLCWGVGVLTGCVLAAAWIFLLNRESWLWPGSSDTASAVLQGRDMLEGNWNLAGWALSANSSWITDIPLFAIADAFTGCGVVVMHAVPLSIFVAMGGVAMAISIRGIASRPGRLAGAVVVLAFIGFPVPAFVVLAVDARNHFGNALFCLFALMCLWISVSRPRAALSGWAVGTSRWQPLW
jgi:hypothetical protein